MDLSFSTFIASSADKDEPLEVQWLRYVETVRDLMDEFAADQGKTDSQTRVIFAEVFVAQFLGEKWVAHHFEAYKGTTAEEHAHFRYILWRLGRLLFDLQSFDWFDGLVQNLRRRDLPGALFEAEVARLLMQLPVNARLRAPTGHKGQDFDIDLGGPGLAVAIEVKAKDERTPFSRGTVKTTLDQARKQLPQDGLGVIFIRVPASWTKHQHVGQLDSMIIAWLRNTSRVQAVAVIWDELADATANTRRFEPRQRVVRRSDVHADIARLLDFLEAVWASEWDAFGPASAL